MENKSIEEIANSQKNFLSTGEVAAVLGISPVTFRRRAEEYAKFFPMVSLPLMSWTQPFPLSANRPTLSGQE